MPTICPKCQQIQGRYEISSVGGRIGRTLCCNTPLDIVDNWDVFGALPAELQQAAIERKEAEFAALIAEWQEADARYEQRLAQWHEQNDHIYA